LFFNLHNLELQASDDPKKFLALLEYHYRGVTMPKGNYSKYKPSRLPMHGFSFLLNPAPIFQTKYLDIGYLVQYVKLAGRRDYALYNFNQVISLDLSYFPDLDRDKIQTNPLLKVINNQLHFKFEEIYYGNRIRQHQGQGTKQEG
jgi:hypothetical protein